MKNCSVNDCPFPSFAKDKLTGIPYCSKHQYLRTDTDKRSAFEKHMDKQKKTNATSKAKTAIRGLANSTTNKGMSGRFALITLADLLFSRFIKQRDADANGNIQCPCCNNFFHLDSKDADNKSIVQPLHFITRDVYSQRYNEDQVFAGCCYCNLKQHLNSEGLEYQNYRAFLVARLGNEKVTEMEDEKYSVNKMPLSDIQAIIDKYKNFNN